MKIIKTAQPVPAPTSAGSAPPPPPAVPGAAPTGAAGLNADVATLTQKMQQIAQLPLINSEDAATFLRIGNYMMSEGSALKKKAQDFLKSNPAA